MESQFSNNAIIFETLTQIKKAINQLFDWNKDITSYEEYMTSQEGVKVLAANCMLLEAIGEGLKKIDRKTNKSLLILRPEIPWTEVMGMRDHIAHGYFDIDAELIYATIKNDLPPLLEAIDFLIDYLTNNKLKQNYNETSC